MTVPGEARPRLVLVEGRSDAAAVLALAALVGCELRPDRIWLQPAEGVTNFPRLLADFVAAHPGAAFCGLYDIADERYVRRALLGAGMPLPEGGSPESFGFFACAADLEDELIRALGPPAVEAVIEQEGELPSLRRFQAMPQHRGTPVHQQLRRFLGTRATRKIRAARRLVEALTVPRLPPPLAGLAAKLLEVSA